MTRPQLHPVVGTELPAWFRQPGESWRAWNHRRLCDIYAEAERKLNEPPNPAVPGPCDLAVGVGTYDANGNPKGSGWW